ncbi:MAG TPA: RNase adapter RapZ [candidate division Zixibacteria bacterium]|nr:RNase adapter RapZ [candidate division Zixibacteria bacterium]
MALRSEAKRRSRTHAPSAGSTSEDRARSRLVIITGLSGSGKVSALKVFEDMGYYCVDNLPVELIPSFGELIATSSETRDGAMVVDIREGSNLDQVPRIIAKLRKRLEVTLIYLEASDSVLVRRFSETRRPHPLGRTSSSVSASIGSERRRLEPIRNIADIEIDTSKFNVHELRQHLQDYFQKDTPRSKKLLVSTVSFGFKNGVPEGADLVFDVRFLPNPHFVPEFRPLTGRHPKVAKYIRSFPQTQEFINRVSDLLIYLLPHYVDEGKSYLTIGFGCTGGQHRSVLIAEEVKKRLAKAGYRVKVEHRDMPR